MQVLRVQVDDAEWWLLRGSLLEAQAHRLNLICTERVEHEDERGVVGQDVQGISGDDLASRAGERSGSG
jgi:hypothetical protein